MEFFRKQKWNFALVLCAVLLVGSAIGMTRSMNAIDHVFAKPSFDEGMIAGTPPDLGDGWSVLGDDSLPFRVGLMNCPKAENDGLSVWFTNPADNAVWLRMEIRDADDRLVGETGLLEAGSYLESVAGNFDRGDDLTIKVMAYVPDLYYSMGSFTIRTQVA